MVFTEDRGWSPGNTGLMFIPIAVGILGGVITSPFVNKHYLHMCSKIEGHAPPELRLIPMICACWLVPIGIFIFAWTVYPAVLWVGPCLAGLPIGFGFVILYNSFNNYMPFQSTPPRIKITVPVQQSNSIITTIPRKLVYYLKWIY